MGLARAEGREVPHRRLHGHCLSAVGHPGDRVVIELAEVGRVHLGKILVHFVVVSKNALLDRLHNGDGGHDLRESGPAHVVVALRSHAASALTAADDRLGFAEGIANHSVCVFERWV